MKSKVYPSLIYDTLRRATFNPQPTAFQKTLEESTVQVFNSFICDLTANEPTMWSIFLDTCYEDFDLCQEYLEQVYPRLHEQFAESLRAFIPTDHNKPYYEHPDTELQHDSPEWHALRHLFITASIAKRVANLTERGTKNFLRSNLWGIDKDENDYRAMKYGRENEPIARECYVEQIQKDIPSAEMKLLGLCQSVRYPELACSPDGVLKTTFITRAIEIKCPLRLEKIDPELFDTFLKDEKLKDFYLYRDDSGRIKLKENHAYYFQVQMVMGVLGLDLCDLIVWSPRGMAIVPICFNPEFWNKLAADLVTFHHSLIIPEYFLQRTPRDLAPIRVELCYNLQSGMEERHVSSSCVA
ncbi:1-deoxy-D-xylulose-5-phosphate synthase [Frankliniella fusca]|uniref:1-deoxy-D-xylulose-5-phosphate synthase n=1 Tax=Frankliniella fusca TaxID=407009 RepID=A0AAE1HFK8_9NEOP|nr:1-deoxy-D-xylulose-5-phosphate synthase [Frankliniella fusca]